MNHGGYIPRPLGRSPTQANVSEPYIAGIGYAAPWGGDFDFRLRGQRHWSQEALAFEAGLHRTFVAHVERRVRNISLDNVERLAKAFGIETHELLTPRYAGDGDR